MNRTTFHLMAGAAGVAKDVVGQVEHLTPGTYNITVADEVYSWSCVAVQGGTGGGAEDGGAGGNLRYSITPISVFPKEVLTLVVGSGGAGTASLSPTNVGTHTTLSRGGTVIFASYFALSASVGGGNGGSGGSAYYYADDANGGGGGGAGGYAGNGGNGGGTTPTAGAGGGGGGGGRRSQSDSLDTGSDGGGVGVRGQGASGAAGNNSIGTSGQAGSGGTTHGAGGGGGYNVDGTIQTAGSNGGPGAFRAIHGQGRSYPSTRTADE